MGCLVQLFRIQALRVPYLSFSFLIRSSFLLLACCKKSTRKQNCLSQFIPLHMKPLFLIVLAMISCETLFSQNNLAERKILPPSPDAAALGKYGEWPVDLSNGLVKIEIPLYTVQSRSIKVPIGLSYHASGNRVNDIASNVGLGWVLNAGGVVTRSVRGKPDEDGGVLNQSFISTADINQANNSQLETIYNYLDSRAVGTYDNESDLYSYNASGISGTFVYDKDDQLVQIPLSDNKIITNPGVAYTIVADDGTSYVFDVVGTSRRNAEPTYATSFYISKIISADKTDTVYFEYTTGGYYDRGVTSSLSHSGTGTTACALQPNTFYVTEYVTKLVNKIRFAGGYVTFTLAGGRSDMGDYRYTDVKVYNDENVLKKWFKLEHSYFTSRTPATLTSERRLKLDQVKLLDINGVITGTYNLQYNSTALPPFYDPGPVPDYRQHFGQDLWGYSNGETQNINFLHAVPAECWATPVANRDVSTTAAQAGMLTEITFPTGGKTVFSYESNFSGITVGGLRIKKVESYDGHNPLPVTRTYEYGNGYSSGNIMVLNTDFYYKYTVIERYGVDYYQKEKYVSSSSVPLSTNSNVAFYANVTEYIGDGTVNTGKTEYEFEAETDLLINPGVNNIYGFMNLRYPHYIVSRSWSRGPLKKSKVYGKNQGAGYTLLKETYNEYHDYGVKNFVTGIISFADINHMDGTYPPPADIITARNNYQYFDIPASTWSKKLIKTTVTDYTSAGNAITIMDYFHEDAEITVNPHLQVTKTTVTTSKGDIQSIVHEYANDFVANAVYNNMWQQNMKSIPIRTTERLNGIDNKGLQVEFSQFTGVGGIMYLPYLQRRFYKGAGWQDDFLIDQYDSRANTTQLHIINDNYKSYLWDYKNKMPIAEIINAKNNDVAYTSFESDGGGNWTLTGWSVDDPTAPTGTKRGVIGNGIAKGGLTPSTVYRVSYWSKGSMCTVYGDQTGNGFPKTGSSIDGWTYFEHRVTGTNSVSIQGPSSIDELRLYPEGAQMKTFTYDPLLGITSQCDVNNRITYYEYDVFGRLSVVRDHDKKIVKKMDYKYRQQ